jgi:hypothetical protein
MTDTGANQSKFDHINQLLTTYPSLMDAYHKFEPYILDWFAAERISIFMRRRQHQDLVARFNRKGQRR